MRKGFTLIELLVVIAIIAILAAILFPVFAKAREKARQTACLNNQHQLSTAILLYSQDHDETLPDGGGVWGAIGMDRAVLICPTAGTKQPIGYAYNTVNCSNAALGAVIDPSGGSDLGRVWLTADADTSGNFDYRHSGNVIASFGDGHVEQRSCVLTWSPSAPIDIAATGTGTCSNATSNTAANMLDTNVASQFDTAAANGVIWAAVTWSSPKTFTTIDFCQCAGYVVNSYLLQVARPGVGTPNGASDSDWVTVATYAGVGSNGAAEVKAANPDGWRAAGVRIRVTDFSNISDLKMRPRELWVFNNAYYDVAAKATATDTWAGTDTTLTDQQFNGQSYTATLPATVTLNWTSAQTITGVELFGGSGAHELITGYTITYPGCPSPITVAGNANWQTNNTFPTPVTTSQITVTVTAGGGSNFRCSEIMAY